jgi:F-type H+-transporting ATPase subunit delta
MSEVKISKRYAKALYEFAVEEKLVDKVYQDMSQLFEVCNLNKDFMRFLKSPIIRPLKKLEVIQEVFGKEFQKVSVNFIRIITVQRREEFLPMIANHFVQLHKDAQGIMVATMKTAVKLDAKMQKKIVTMLQKQTGSKIELDTEVNEDLLGGFILKVDNKEIDTTIKSKLVRLNSEFDNNPYERKF